MEEEYNRIVLIGNGFDKALGLKTSYSDFIFDYFKEALSETIYNGEYEDGLISLHSDGQLHKDLIESHKRIIKGNS